MISLLEPTILGYLPSVLSPVKCVLFVRDSREKMDWSEVYLFESRLSRAAGLSRLQFATDEIRTTNQSVSFRPAMSDRVLGLL